MRGATRLALGMAPVGATMALALAGCAPGAAGEGGAEASAAIADPGLAAAVAEAPVLQVYKTSWCGCCALWVDHMRAAGFRLEVEDRDDDLVAVKRAAGLPPRLQSCHTALAGDYVFEGHIPAEVIARFLDEAPDARGLVVAGMPVGSPGMEMGSRVDPYDVLALHHDGSTSVYESRR